MRGWPKPSKMSHIIHHVNVLTSFSSQTKNPTKTLIYVTKSITDNIFKKIKAGEDLFSMKVCVSYASKWGEKQQKIRGNPSSCARYWKTEEQGLEITRICAESTRPPCSVKATALEPGQASGREVRHALKKHGEQ